MTDPLDDMERMVDDWERDATEKAAKYQAMGAAVEQISITESVADGAVSVTVGHNGLPTDVRMTDKVKAMEPSEIAGNVLAAMRKAQSRYPQRLAEIMSETVGEDSTTEYLLNKAEQNFPSVEDEDEATAESRAFGRKIKFGPEEEEEQQPAPKRPPAKPRPSRSDDEVFENPRIFNDDE